VSTDDDAAPPSLFACIGAVPISLDVHDEASDWEELRALLDAIARRENVRWACAARRQSRLPTCGVL